MKSVARWLRAVEVRSAPWGFHGAHSSREGAERGVGLQTRRPTCSESHREQGREKEGTRLHGSLCVEHKVISTCVSILRFHLDKHRISY